MKHFKCRKQVLLAVCIILLANGAAAENLNQAWNTAIAADHSLKSVRENTAAANQILAASKSARLPGVSLEAGFTALEHEPAIIFAGTQIPTAQDDFVAYKAMTTLPLYTGGRISQGIDAATALVKAAELGETSSTQNLKLRVADAYISVLRTTRGLKVAESHVASLDAHARDVDNLREQGLVVKTAALSAQVSLLDARQRALQATNGLELAQSSYNRLLGRSLEQSVELEELSPSLGNENISDLTERALVQSSELAAMERQIEALRHQARAIKGENLPQIGVAAGYGRQQNRYMVEDGSWSVALGMKWNVFDGGVVRSKAGAIERQAASLIEQRDDLRSLIRLQVRQAWLDVGESRKRTEVTRAAIAQAEENLRVVRDRYVNGLASHTEVLDAETLRVNSETNHANAFFDAVMAELRLKRAVGEL